MAHFPRGSNASNVGDSRLGSCISIVNDREEPFLESFKTSIQLIMKRQVRHEEALERSLTRHAQHIIGELGTLIEQQAQRSPSALHQSHSTSFSNSHGGVAATATGTGVGPPLPPVGYNSSPVPPGRVPMVSLEKVPAKRLGGQAASRSDSQADAAPLRRDVAAWDGFASLPNQTHSDVAADATTLPAERDMDEVIPLDCSETTDAEHEFDAGIGPRKHHFRRLAFQNEQRCNDVQGFACKSDVLDEGNSDDGDIEPEVKQIQKVARAPEASPEHGEQVLVKNKSFGNMAKGSFRISTFGSTSRLPVAQGSDTCSLRRWVSALTQHRKFEVAVALLIMANAAVIGAQADWAINHIGVEEPKFFKVLEYFFAIAFSTELVLHIIDEGVIFWSMYNRNIKWNVFDSFVVASSWVEDVAALFATTSLDVGSFRAIRIVRLVRILRIIKVMRFFTELRTMVQGIMASLKPLVWCLMLLLMVMFTFGILILQMAYQQIVDYPDADHSDLVGSYGGLVVTVYTLYTCITGGQDWADAAAHLMNIHPVMAILFAFYIAFAVLCVLNIVTGVFVDNANAITKADAEQMVLEEMQLQGKRLDEMKRVFAQAVSDGSDELNMEDFKTFCKNEKVQAYFRRIGLNVEGENAKALFALIDKNDNKAVDLPEFVLGCNQFMGNARQLDIAELRVSTDALIRRMEELLKLCQGSFSGPGACHAKAGASRGLPRNDMPAGFAVGPSRSEPTLGRRSAFSIHSTECEV